MRVIVAIPARIDSTRLPEKALADIRGEPMIVRVWRRAGRIRGVGRVIVATDDRRIRDAVQAAGGEAALTARSHPSGTDRIAEAVRGLPGDLVVNLQGDEPFLDPAAVEALIGAFDGPAPPEAATLATPVTDAAELYRPSVVKVHAGRDGFAVTFSRYPVPWRGDLWADGWSPAFPPPDPSGYLRHVGVYAYRPAFLRMITALEPTPGERAEHLEQLRILENGLRIRVVVAPWDGIAVDTPEDLARARARAARE